MDFLLNLKDKLKGFKTYLVGAGAVIAALLAYISGEMDIIQTGQAVFAAIMGMTIRAGVESNKE